MRGDHAGVVPGLQQAERAVDPGLAHVVGVDDHVQVHHPLDDVLAQRREPARVAVRRGRVDGRDAARQAGRAEQLPDHTRDLRHRRVDVVVVQRARAGLRAPERPGAGEVAGVDQQADRAAVEAHADERVVELVQQQHGTHAEAMQLVKPRVDLRLVARRVAGARAAERLGDLDLQHDGHPPLVDHAACLLGVGDDLEETPCRARRTAVDVVLELVDRLEAVAYGVHLVAVGLAVGLQQAEDPVLVGAHDHQPQPGHPRALDPAPVGALVGQVGRRPGREGRPAGGVVRLDRVVVVEEVLHRRREPLRSLDRGAVGQGIGDAVRVPGLAAVEAAAEKLIGHPVHVALQQAADAAVAGVALGRRAGRVQLGVGVVGAAGGRGEGDVAQRGATGGGREGDPAVARGVDPPVRRRAWGGVDADRTAWARGDESAVRRVEQVTAQRGRLHADTAGAWQ